MSSNTVVAHASGDLNLTRTSFNAIYVVPRAEPSDEVTPVFLFHIAFATLAHIDDPMTQSVVLQFTELIQQSLLPSLEATLL